jgi:hypothetical protein
MERYLGKLVSEYESAVPSDAGSFGMADLPKLEDFIRRDHGSGFHFDFVTPYHRVAEAVAEAELRDLEAGRWTIAAKARFRER